MTACPSLFRRAAHTVCWVLTAPENQRCSGALSGIYRLSSGELFIDGEPVYDNAKVKERVFFINDETVQFNSMTLTEMKQYYKSFYGTFSEELWQKLYSALNLPLKKRLNTFSKGMKRQAAVICGIACRTPYLFLDEAFDGLDPTMRIIVKQMLIDAMVDSKLTVIFSSHNLGEIDEFCDRVGLLHGGKVVFDRELDSVKGSVFKIQTVVPGAGHEGAAFRGRRGYPPCRGKRQRNAHHRQRRPRKGQSGGGKALPEAVR